MDNDRYRALFVAEARDHIAAAQERVDRLEGDPALAADELPALMRHAHSLKGMAATIGHRAMIDLANALEELVEHARPCGPAAAAAIAPLCLEALVRLEAMVAAVNREADPDDAGTPALVARLRRTAGSLGSVPEWQNDEARRVDVAEAAKLPRYRVGIWIAPGSAPVTRRILTLIGRIGSHAVIVSIAPPIPDAETGRFRERLDLLLGYDAGQESLERLLGSISAISHFTVEVATVEHSGNAPQAPPIPLFTRVRTDLLEDAARQALHLMLEHGRLEVAVRSGLAADPLQLNRCRLLQRELYSTLTELRLVPFDSLEQRLKATVRRLAERLGKRARLSIVGGAIRMERSTLDALADPLLHMVRNALDHGLESPAEREAAGKEPVGSLVLRVSRDGSRVLLAFEDDGRGLSPTAIRAVAVSRGLLGGAEASRLSDHDALRLVTLPGFSTANELTEVSGRGIGMDVVRAAVEQLGGRLDLETTAGLGTRVLLSLPLNHALIQVLLVRCGDELLAIPGAAVRRTIPIRAAVARPAPCGSLAGALGLPGAATTCAAGSTLVLAAGGREVRLDVDEVVAHREILLSPLRPPLSELRLYSGAALLEDGGIALVVDAAALLELPVTDAVPALP